MKRGLFILAGLVVITIAGGILTADIGLSVPILQQTADPTASPFEAPPDQALLLLMWVGFVLFNVVGAGATIAFVFWLLNREVKRANETPTLAEQAAQENEALPQNVQA